MTNPTTNYFIGKDGRSYLTSEALMEANDAWKGTNISFIGRDGRHYFTPEDLSRANDDYKKRTFANKGPGVVRLLEKILKPSPELNFIKI